MKWTLIEINDFIRKETQLYLKLGLIHTSQNLIKIEKDEKKIKCLLEANNFSIQLYFVDQFIAASHKLVFYFFFFDFESDTSGSGLAFCQFKGFNLYRGHGGTVNRVARTSPAPRM